jgi:hypothetical protein
VDTDSESCKHLENQTVAGELVLCFRENAFIKQGNGTLGGGVFYAGRLAVIKGSGLVNSSGDACCRPTAINFEQKDWNCVSPAGVLCLVSGE